MPPTAYTYRPYVVRLITNQAMAYRATISTTAFGTPAIDAERPSHVNRSGTSYTDPPWARMYASPLATCITPSVAMNGGSLNSVTSPPANRPMAAQTRMPTADATSSVPVPAEVPPWSRIRMAVVTAERAIRLPTLRSIPPVMMTSVMPTATTATTAIWLATFSRVVGQQERRPPVRPRGDHAEPGEDRRVGPLGRGHDRRRRGRQVPQGHLGVPRAAGDGRRDRVPGGRQLPLGGVDELPVLVTGPADDHHARPGRHVVPHLFDHGRRRRRAPRLLLGERRP